jgi:hypothetical protein
MKLTCRGSGVADDVSPLEFSDGLACEGIGRLVRRRSPHSIAPGHAIEGSISLQASIEKATCSVSETSDDLAVSQAVRGQKVSLVAPQNRFHLPDQRSVSVFRVADHSKSAHYAGGLSVEQIAEQHREADGAEQAPGQGSGSLKGFVSDILADGSLDYPDVLDRFDFVVASIHGRFKLDRKAQTACCAISNPHTTIVGHMTGRQFQRRPGYEIDVEKVVRACAKHGVAVEINAHPWR